jgi:hypothetical protein
VARTFIVIFMCPVYHGDFSRSERSATRPP